jgi:microsomal epoxide hydrolase
MIFRSVILLSGLLLTTATSALARERNVDVAPDISLHIIDSGPEDARLPTLVLIPGWGFAGSIWSAQIDAFDDDRRVIAIDPRSQGDSTKTADGYTPEQRADDLHVLLGKLGVRRFVLVGWSQGVQDVAAYVLRHGTAPIDGVVLVDSMISGGAANVAASPGMAAQQLGLLPILAEAPRDYTEGLMRAVITRALAPAELDALISEALKTPTAIRAAMLVADMFGTDRSAAVAKIDRPALIIASPRSSELAAQRDMAAKIAGSEFHIVDNAGHAVFFDQPDRFNALLGEFLARLSSTAPHPAGAG